MFETETDMQFHPLLNPWTFEFLTHLFESNKFMRAELFAERARIVSARTRRVFRPFQQARSAGAPFAIIQA
jgi:hypothetical protein